MSPTTCPRCLRSLASTVAEWERGACPIELSESLSPELDDAHGDSFELDCRTAEVAVLRARVAELETARSTLHDDYWSRVRRCKELEQENARLRREVEDVHALDEHGDYRCCCSDPMESGDPRLFYAVINEADVESWHDAESFPAARRAAVEYLKKGGKGG